MPATLRWTAPSGQATEKARGKDAAPADKAASRSPTIKNHSATHIGRELFVFGGYDGLRNHNAVHVLDCETLDWRQAEVCVSPFFASFLCAVPFPLHRLSFPLSFLVLSVAAALLSVLFVSLFCRLPSLLSPSSLLSLCLFSVCLFFFFFFSPHSFLLK
jgi:hypothetical protein